MLQVRLLGQFDILADGKRVVIPARAGQSLFSYLVLNAGAAHRREKLAGLIWPDLIDETARRNLRQQLWLIRKALASSAVIVTPQSASTDYLRVDEMSIAFDPQADFWLDVAQLERPLALHVSSPDDELNDLINKLSLYRGELLPGFYDEWLVLERERVHAIFESRMQLLMEQLVAAERWMAVLEWGEKWLSFGDTSEPAFRALMLAHATRGDMSQVTTIYQRCVQTLREELGVEPSIETRALYDGLVKGAQITARMQPAQPSGTVTFLFTDIEGSTRLLDRLREDYGTVLHEHHELLRAAVKKWNGKEIDTQGDAFFVTFSRATDAIACAVDAQRALQGHAWSQGERVRVRMGLHTGEPLMATTGYIGMDVHRAARIGDAGHGGQVLLSQTTRDLVVHELPKAVALRDLGEHRLKDLKFPFEIYQLVVDGLQNDFPPLKTTFSGTEPPAPGDAPFKGLQYFDVQDAAVFFGREALTAKLMERLQTSPPPRLQGEGGRLLVVVGASGSGKSSVVRAGVVPALMQKIGATENVASSCEIITPTVHPLEALAMALTRDSESITATASLLDDLGKDPRALHLFLARRIAIRDSPIADRDAATAVSDTRYAVRNTLLVVDQFEELFTLCRDEFERQAFIDNLLYAIAQFSALTLILTLRADFYAHLAQYPELRDAIARNQEYIGPMTGDELRRAMEGPAKLGHWEFEPGLVDLILRDVGDEPGALPLLSHALLETWKRRAAYTMTLKGYHDAGSVRGAIAHTADSTFEQLSPEQQQIARHLFLRLTELGEGTEDTRRRASFDELMSHTSDPAQTRAVLNTLADARLITLGQDNAEVAHEALIREWGRLREWLNQDREGLRLHRSLTEAAQEWELLERDSGALYRGARLAQARDWMSHAPESQAVPGLNESEQAFIAASVAQESQEEQDKVEQQQRELDAAKQIAVQSQVLAAEQSRRAEEQTKANKRLRQRALFLVGALGLALVLAAIALFLGGQARVSAAAADKNAAVAEVNEQTARNNSSLAETEKRIATARELAAAATNNLTIDPERSILLAMQAVAATAQDKTVLTEAASALHAAIQTSRVQLNLLGHTSSVQSVAVNAAGTEAATTSQDGTAKIWDIKTGKELLSVQTNNTADLYGISAVFTPDGTQLLTWSDNNSAQLWDLKTGHVVQTLTGHTDYVGAVAVSPDGKMFATASGDKTAKLWDAATGKELFTLAGHTAGVDVIAFGPDGSRFYTGSSGDGTAKAWDTKTGKELFTFSGQGATTGVDTIAVSPDGTLIATGEFDTNVKIWDAADGKLLRTLFGHASFVTGVAFSADGKYLASSAEDGTARIWDPLTGRELLRLDGHTSGVLSIAFVPDGTRVVTVSRDGTGKVWDISPSGSREWLTLVGHAARVKAVAYSPDGRRLATAGYDGVVKIWDAASGKNLFTLAPNGNPYGGDVSYSPDGKRLAVTGKNTVKIVEAESGTEILALAPFGDGVISVVYSRDGRRLAAGSGDGQVKIYDSINGSVLVEFKEAPGDISQIAFSPDGLRIATAGGADSVSKVWDALSGKLLLTFNEKVRPNEITFSPDGKWIASSGNDGTIKVWDSVTGTIYFTLRGHTGATFGVAFSPDGKQLATSSVDRTVKVWTLPQVGEQVGEPLTLLGHKAAVYRVVFSPDGTKLATASRDGTSRIYALPIQDLIQIAKSRVTRALTADECQKFLHLPQCPPAS